MKKLTECTKEEHGAFIAAYPRPLIRDVLKTCVPEQLQHNDFSLGDWPDSVVATYDCYGHTPGDIYGPDPGGWKIAKEAAASLVD